MGRSIRNSPAKVKKRPRRDSSGFSPAGGRATLPGVTPSPESAPAKCRPWGRRFAAFLLVAIRHSSHWILRIFFTLLLLAGILFAYLHLVGLPAYCTDRFLDRMAQYGYHLQIERLALEVDRGLVARRVRAFLTADAPEPFLEAAELTVAVNPIALLRRREVVPVLSIEDGALRARLGRNRIGAREGSREIAVERIRMRFSADAREVLLREFSADFLGIHFRGRGAFYPAAQPQAPAGNPLAAAMDAIERAPEWALRAVEQANQIAFREPPSADFTFALRPDRPEAHAAAFRLSAAGGGQVRGVDFDRFELEVALNNQQVQLPDLQIHRAGGVLGLSGWFDLTNRTASAHLVNTLSPATFLELLPDRIQSAAAAATTNYDFPLRLELQVGPAPVAEWTERFSGRLEFSRAVLRGVPVERLEASFRRAGNEVRLDQAALQLDTGPLASRLKIRDAFFLLDRKRFEAHAAGALDPHLLKPVMTPNIRNVVEWFGIREPIQGEVTVGGTVGDPAIYCFGPVQATNVAINGVAIQSVQGRLDVTNEVLHLRDTTLVRPEGVARGDVHLAFSNQTLRLEQVESTVDPRAVAQMIGPAAVRFLEPFQLNGPVHARVDGVLDYCNFSLNRLDARVDARRFGYSRWEADAAEFDLAVRGLRFRFTNAVATAYGGQFAGQGVLYPVGNDATWRYEVDVAARGANLSNLLSASIGKPVGDLRGLVDGEARLGGYIGAGTGPTVTGAGHVDVREGLLFQTKLFSGLSAILSKVLPDFTLFAQTDAGGDFTIRNSRVHSRNVQLQGTLFSAKGAGHYSFGGDLDFRVEVQLLRSGPVAALVRLATLPVTRLLELRLTGTFEDPRWRPLNLNPAELFSGEDKDPKPAAPAAP